MMSNTKARPKASAVFIWRFSTRQTSFKTWCQHSMPQRNPYQRTSRRAVFKSLMGQLVRSSHSIGSAPAGGLTSVAIKAQSDKVPQLFLHPTRGGRSATGAQRKASVAWRAGRSLLRGIFTDIVPPRGPPEGGRGWGGGPFLVAGDFPRHRAAPGRGGR